MTEIITTPNFDEFFQVGEESTLAKVEIAALLITACATDGALTTDDISYALKFGSKPTINAVIESCGVTEITDPEAFAEHLSGMLSLFPDLAPKQEARVQAADERFELNEQLNEQVLNKYQELSQNNQFSCNMDVIPEEYREDVIPSIVSLLRSALSGSCEAGRYFSDITYSSESIPQFQFNQIASIDINFENCAPSVDEDSLVAFFTLTITLDDGTSFEVSDSLELNVYSIKLTPDHYLY